MNRRQVLASGISAAALAAGRAESWPVVPGIYGGTVVTPTGDPLAGGTYFGIENEYFPHNNFSVATKTLAANAGAAGGNGFRLSLSLPVNSLINLPAYAGGSTAQDHWWFMRARMPFWGFVQSNTKENLFAVAGQTDTATTGGALAYKTLALTQGSASTGWQIDPVNAGLPYFQRQAFPSTWQLFNQSPIGFVPTGNVNFQPGVTYGLCFGVHYDPVGAAGAGDYGILTAATLGGTTPQTVEATLVSGTTRPAAQLFNLIGEEGNGATNGASAGFTGEASDLWIVNGPYPSQAQIQAITNGTVTMEAVCTGNGATIRYHNTLDYSQLAGGVIADDPRYNNLGGVIVNNATGIASYQTCGPHMQNGLLTLTRKSPWWVWATTVGAADGQVWFEGTTPSGASLQARVQYQDGAVSAWTTHVVTAGAYAFSIRAPVGKNFRRQVRLYNQAVSAINEGDLHAVGYVIPFFGQSEMAIQNSLAASFTSYPPVLGSLSSGASVTATDVGQSVNRPFSSIYDSRYLLGTGNGYQRSKGFIPSCALISGQGNPGDGLVEVANAIMALGVSCMLSPHVHSGEPKDDIVDCNLTFTLPTAAGTPSVGLPSGTSGTGPWTFSPQLTTPILQNAFNQLGYPGNSVMVLSNQWLQQIKQGTLVVTLSDGTVLVDDNAAVGGTPFAVGGMKVQTAGSPGGGATVNTSIASSYVNYCTEIGSLTTGGISGTTLTVASGAGIILGQFVNGAGVTPGTVVVSGAGTSWVVSISQTVAGGTALVFTGGGPAPYPGTVATSAQVQITLAANPNAATIVSVVWQEKQEGIDGGNQKTTFINGYGTWEAFDAVFSQIGPYGMTMLYGYWVTAEMAEAPPGPGMTGDQSAKWSRLRAMVSSYARGSVDSGLASPNMILCVKARDAGGGVANVIGQTDQTRVAQMGLWSTTAWGTSQLSWVLPSYWNLDIDTNGVSSVHQGSGVFGTNRLGERQAADIAAVLAANPIALPSWTVPVVFSGNTCTINATIGVGQSLTVDLANGGSASALDSWYMGTSVSAGTLVDNGAFATAAIVGASVVITKTSGNWLGTEIVRYAVGIPGTTAAAAPRGLVYVTGPGLPSFTWSPGIMMPPLWYPNAGQPDDSHP